VRVSSMGRLFFLEIVFLNKEYTHINDRMILKQIIPAKHYTQAKVSEWVDWVTEAFERRNVCRIYVRGFLKYLFPQGLKYRNDILKAVHKTFTQSQFFGCAYFDVNVRLYI